MIARTHVNMHVIKRNHKTGEREPALTVKTSKGNEKAHEVHFLGPSKLVYSPDKPLDCGARVWIESQREDMILITNETERLIFEAVMDAEVR